MSRLLPRYTTITSTDALKVDKIVGNSTAPDITITNKNKQTEPGDKRKLRGIPVVGGVGGTSPGTDPLGALLHKENLRERNQAA